jgi:hypothetical protein
MSGWPTCQAACHDVQSRKMALTIMIGFRTAAAGATSLSLPAAKDRSPRFSARRCDDWPPSTSENVSLDDLQSKVRHEGAVRTRAIHIAPGVRAGHYQETRGLWLVRNEGAAFCLPIVTSSGAATCGTYSRP